jgi:hypothetical protein
MKSRIPEIEPSDTTLAYLAGLIDGEGSIQINPSRGKSGKRYWCLTIQISSVGDGFLEEMRDRCGALGTITYWKSRGVTRAHHRRITNWRIYALQGRWLLERVLPYLVLKKDQAEVALAFLAKKIVGRNKIPLEVKDERYALAMRMRQLNAKTGKALPSNKDYSDVI